MIEHFASIRSVADLIDAIKRLRSSFARQKLQIYYRGEPEDYGETAGTPSIGRNNRLKNEAQRFRECERRLPEEFARCKSTFEKLVLMQHYKIPTRLLDISLDPLTALFFAIYEDPLYKINKSKDATILVYGVPENLIKNYHSDAVSVVANLAIYDKETFDISAMPDTSTKVGCAKFNAEQSMLYLLHEIRAEKPYFMDVIKKEDLGKILCVHPLLDNPRIKVQQGAFLLFGLDGSNKKLATYEKNPDIKVFKICIPSNARGRLEEELKILSKTVDNVYPDWDGARDYFERYWNKE